MEKLAADSVDEKGEEDRRQKTERKYRTEDTDGMPECGEELLFNVLGA